MMLEIDQLNAEKERSQNLFGPRFGGPSFEEILMVGKRGGIQRDPKYLIVRKRRDVKARYIIQRMNQLLDWSRRGTWRS